ncbi:MAG TPA: hypothetical protein VMO80_16025 [Terriglobales bacterium]|jgi:hypothetical protein|nr:hypothetical protein [Terriglobales bacterium]
MAETHESILAIESRFFKRPVFGELVVESNVPRSNQQKEANDHGTISDQEVWSAIRYLDPESDDSESDITAGIALLVVVCIVCLVCALLHLRGL